jgi:hypothetical protein
MEQISIHQELGAPFYCPFCGTCNQFKYVEGQDVKFKSCDHLLYIGTNEGGFEYLNPKYENRISEDMDEDDLMNLKINNGIHFSLCAPPPSTFGVFFGYQL